ncbi:MAG: FxLYD domain-containing protein [Nitrososphaeraceae archaeon]
MSVYYVILPIIIISLTLIFSGLINITYGQVNTNLTEESIENNLNGLQILSHNSFTDSVGYLHVVGEVQNNTPANAQFVQVIGTFYDNNNQVVGTQFAYTNPSDIGAGQKAPFELILTSASIPVSQIDRYNLITSSQ